MPSATCLGKTAHFVMIAPANDGLDADFKNNDGGVGDITLDGPDIGRFKSPSLRNVDLTAPYMHDGRFDTLEKVIDHYSKGVKPHPNLDIKLRQPECRTAGGPCPGYGGCAPPFQFHGFREGRPHCLPEDAHRPKICYRSEVLRPIPMTCRSDLHGVKACEVLNGCWCLP